MERTPGGLFLVDPESRSELTRAPQRPPFAKPQPPPAFSTGRSFDVRLASEYFITDPQAWLVELDRPALLLVRSEITHDALIPILEECARDARSIAIGAPTIGVDASLLLIVNKLRGLLWCAAFEAEASQLEELAQIAGSTGAFADPSGLSLAALPAADKVVMSTTALSIKPR